MITAIIRNKENTLVLDFPRSIYDLYEKLQSVGIMKSPKQIPLTDSEDEDIGVKLFSDNDFGNHLLLTLSKDNSLADANLLTYIVQNASEDIKETLEQDMVLFFLIYAVFGSVLSLTAFFSRIYTSDLKVTFSDAVKACLLCVFEITCLRFVLAWVRATAFFGYRKKKLQWGRIERKKINFK